LLTGFRWRFSRCEAGSGILIAALCRWVGGRPLGIQQEDVRMGESCMAWQGWSEGGWMGRTGQRHDWLANGGCAWPAWVDGGRRGKKEGIPTEKGGSGRHRPDVGGMGYRQASLGRHFFSAGLAALGFGPGQRCPAGLPLRRRAKATETDADADSGCTGAFSPWGRRRQTRGAAGRLALGGA